MARFKDKPGWGQIVEGWKRTQAQLRQRLRVCALEPLPRFVAGADAAFDEAGGRVFAAAVVYDAELHAIVEVAHASRPIQAPYVPGFLSFREGPAVLAAIANLTHEFGAVLFDGQGYAHPRRCGLASHLAIQLDLPGVGVAKSRFIGQHREPGLRRGCSARLMDGDEQIGLVLRTQDGVRPVYVSVGHRVDLPSATRLVLACCPRYRVPEPTRQADIEVARAKSLGCR